MTIRTAHRPACTCWRCRDEREKAAALREYHGRPDLDRVRSFMQGAAWMLTCCASGLTVVVLVWFLWV